MSDRREIQKTSGTSVEEAKPRLKKPRMFRVLLMNDDYTPMEFVVMVLQRIFKLPHEQAVQVMLKVHTEGAGVCGVFTAEVAETRVCARCWVSPVKMSIPCNARWSPNRNAFE